MLGWAVALDGEQFDLRVLTEQFRSPQIRVVEGRDCYELQAAVFEGLHEPNAVRDLGLELIKRLNGAAKLHWSAFKAVKFGGSIARYHPEGHRELHLYPPPLTGRSYASAWLTVGAEDPAGPPPPTICETRMSAAASDDRVARALRLFGYEHTWDNLHKVVEVMIEDVGSDKIKRDYPRGERLGVFHSTANNRQAIGDAARHGHEQHQPPRNPMSWSEASTLVRGWLIHWLASRDA